MAGFLDTTGWKFYLVIGIPLVVAIILVILIGYPMIQHQAAPLPGGSVPPTEEGFSLNPVTSGNASTAPGSVPPPSGTVPESATPVPTISPHPLPTTAIVPVPFSLMVTPQSASARPGDTLTYTLDIRHGEGLTEPIHFSLAAQVLFFSQTYDLGTIDPPFPKSLKYDFTVPGNLPSGVTVKGVITATGNGQTESQDISLNVL